jgi:hypothetical protein
MTRSWITLGLGCVLLAAAAIAQTHHDPLNSTEIDELRDTALEPDKRLKLYVQFARARLDNMEQARTDPKVTNRGQMLHDRLQDFLDVYDELTNNVDNFANRKSDLRKPLKFVIDADTEFDAKLRALRDAANVPKEEASKYEFVLTNALEALESSTQDHRDLLAEQEEAFKHKKPPKQ